MNSKREFGIQLKKYSLLELKVKEIRSFIQMYFGDTISTEEKNLLLRISLDTHLFCTPIPIELLTSEVYEN